MKVLALSDTHCGSWHGLVPPKWWPADESHPFYALAREGWGRFEAAHEKTRYDVVIANGDMIDGKSAKTGGVGLVTADRQEQVAMARAVLDVVVRPGKTKAYLTRGTRYHVGDSEDWEDALAREIGAPIENRLFLELDGVSFDCRHKVGSSSVPYGRGTALAKAHTWAQLWAQESEGHPAPAGVILRSHVHYHQFTGGPSWVAMTLPALQALGSDFGTRDCEGVVHWGWVTFQVAKGKFTWEAHTETVGAQEIRRYKA